MLMVMSEINVECVFLPHVAGAMELVGGAGGPRARASPSPAGSPGTRITEGWTSGGGGGVRARAGRRAPLAPSRRV